MRYPKILWIIGRGGAGIEGIIMLLYSEIDEKSVLEAINARKNLGFEGFARV